jgi:hypothetical protein
MESHAALRKIGAISLRHCQLQICLCMNEQVNITHHMWLPYPLSRNINQCSPWADWTPPTKLKNINRKL